MPLTGSIARPRRWPPTTDWARAAPGYPAGGVTMGAVRETGRPFYSHRQSQSARFTIDQAGIAAELRSAMRIVRAAMPNLLAGQKQPSQERIVGSFRPPRFLQCST